MDKDVQLWFEQASYDLETARAMLQSGRYLYILFTCQQAIEKLLKAHVINTTKQFPPRTHDLAKLLNVAAIELVNEQELFLKQLSFYYIKTRYPEEISKLAAKVNAAIGQSCLKQTEELFICLKQKLKP